MKATDTFRNPAYGHNCAQAVANKWKDLYESADIVTEYSPYIGGRAPGGLCGAVFAAMQALPEHADEIRKEFTAICGAETCRAIKMETGTPCEVCVDTADTLVEKYKGISQNIS